MSDNTQHCLLSIRSNYKNFSEKEKIIADFTLMNPHKIIHFTINQVSEKLGISEATVFRFCRRIGFKGFQDMKISLATEVVTSVKDIHEKINEEDSIGVITRKSFQSNIKTIEDTLRIQDENLITKVVEAILGAQKIQFFGVGGSAFVALDAYHKFIRSGINVNADLDSHLQMMSASQMTNNDLAIIISHSGSTKDILDLMQIFEENETQTVAITNFTKSPLTEKADISLYTIAAETDFRSEALSSRIAQLSIIDALYVNVMIANKESSWSVLQKMRGSMSIKYL
ncbi:RpiR family transcriptional regulator [Virgibacillus profundi]|uniref:RpiR family transcriptional regulator n=1 Tax=Virgibacillus profundi TaxID=2024555 RepID=A0A2A2I9H7_9BACI|nr:MurR/RpiR family transcriptional regulator [Virgibacillus profundi]PAV28379.1 RpiR family transcriptional regulator [Virgibacillus profundi]PXY52259.1 MurR/RpiR family transcriptional regulator [Virgibacillus profundi]